MLLCVCVRAFTLCWSVEEGVCVDANCVYIYVCVYPTVWVIGSGPYQQQTENHTEPDPGEPHWHGKTVTLSLSHFLFHSFFLFHHHSFLILCLIFWHKHAPLFLPFYASASICFPISPPRPYVWSHSHKMHYGSSLSGHWSLTHTFTHTSHSG